MFFSVQSLLFAQNQELRQFSVEDGLPQSQVYDMVQDHQGYLWLATQGGGLARFNGKDFKVYNTNNGLGSNYINAFYAANDTIFIGTKRGLSIKVKEDIVSTATPEIHRITQINGTTYLLTGKGLFTLSNLNSDKGIEKTEKVSLEKTLDQSRINDIIYDGKQYWIASNQGLYNITNIKNEPAERMVEDNFVALLKFQDRILAATASEGLYSFIPNQFEDSFLVLEGFKINDISIQNEKEVWIATKDQGIYRLDLKTHEPEPIVNYNMGLNTKNVKKVLTDRQGNTWIATSGGGFYKYFQNNFRHYDDSSGRLGNRIYAIHTNQDGVWVSHSKTGISKVGRNGVQNISPPEQFKNIKFSAIASDENRNLYLGSDGNGIWLRHLKIRDTFIEDHSKISELRKIKIPLKSISNHEISTNTGFPHDRISNIIAHADTVWAATYASGIVKFSYNPELKKPLKIYRETSIATGVENLYINHILHSGNKLWYATKNGKLGYIEGNRVNHLGKVLGEEVAINSILVYNNRIFLGTAGRGIWWSVLSKQLSFKKLKGSKPLSSENSLQLIFDNDGYLWSGSERGVDKILLNQDTEITDVFRFGSNDGFFGIETTLNAVDKDDFGRLWFGTIKGLTAYIPSNEHSNSDAPQLFLEELKINLKSIDSLNLEHWTDTKRVLKLAPYQNQVTIGFNSVDLNHPNSIEYRTKWNDTEWTAWTTNNSRNFSGLSYGKHTISIQSRNYRWKESDVKKVSIFIERPLHRKIWFQWLLSGIVVLILALFIAMYIKRLNQKNKRRQHQLEIENHLLDLEQKALRLQMNPHFMFNVLNGIKAMAKTKPDAMDTTINDFAALLRSTLTSSRKESISLQEEIDALHHYIKLELQMAPKSFNYSINLNSHYAAEGILIPPMLIQPFVENAIRHGILKGNGTGILTIDFSTSQMSLYVKITDNGLGIFESQNLKAVSDHQSMALKVTKERLESISGKNVLMIKELKADNGSIRGTEVKFKLPLETEY